MKKFITALVATAVLATVPFAAATQSAEAGNKWWKKAIVGGVAAGATAAIVDNALRPRQRTVIVQQQPQPVYVAPQPVGFSQAHYHYCHAKYRSYHAPSNTFQPYTGPRRPCYSPY